MKITREGMTKAANAAGNASGGAGPVKTLPAIPRGTPAKPAVTSTAATKAGGKR